MKLLNTSGRALAVSSGGIIGPGETVTVGDPDVHDQALIDAGHLSTITTPTSPARSRATKKE